jgi:hypothetical protein
MRKIYLGFERSDFDARMIRLFPKASEGFLGKLMTYYLLSLDWLSSEDCAQLKKEVPVKLNQIVDTKKNLFDNERQCYLHQLNVSLIEFMVEFLEDRHLIQHMHFKQHNFTNIIAFIKNCTSEFKGLVYLNMRIEREIKMLKFVLNFEYKYGEEVDMELLVRFLTCVLKKEYLFMNELLVSFRKKYQTIKNETLLMEFYDCYTEFVGCSNLLENLYKDFDWYFDQKKIPKIQLIYVDHEISIELEKTLFSIKSKFKSNFVNTKNTYNR